MSASQWRTDKEGNCSRRDKPTPEGGAGSMLDVIWKLAHLERAQVQERAQGSVKLTVRLCAVQVQESVSQGGAARSRHY